jgi:ABC-type lipoprotein release transport system permease subunit
MAGGGLVAVMVNPGILEGRASEWLLLAVVGGMFLTAAILASWLPARKASLIDPIAALKND